MSTMCIPPCASTMASHSPSAANAAIAHSAPSSFFARHPAQQLPSLSGAAVSEEHAILEPFRYTCSVAGKGMRSRIIEVFNYWLKVSDACRVQTAAIVEKLHNASLIIGAVASVPIRSYHACNTMRCVLFAATHDCMACYSHPQRKHLKPQIFSTYLSPQTSRRHRRQLPAAPRTARRARCVRRSC